MPELTSRLQGEALAWFSDAAARLETEGAKTLAELLPQLARRIGREPLGGGRIELAGAKADLDAWRLCDAAAYSLLRAAAPGPDSLIDLFSHGDLEERTLLLRSLSLLEITKASLHLLEEVQRTNTLTHFAAAVCDSNLAVRACAHADFGQADFNRLILKLAFLELPLARVLEAESCANPELSRMLQGLATEREAAGRAVWPDTNRLIAAAPTEGTLARLIGQLEHGDDRLRLAAADGLAGLRDPRVAEFVAARLAREPRAEIRAALEHALGKAPRT